MSEYVKDAVETTLLITADQVKINFHVIFLLPQLVLWPFWNLEALTTIFPIAIKFSRQSSCFNESMYAIFKGCFFYMNYWRFSPTFTFCNWKKVQPVECAASYLSASFMPSILHYFTWKTLQSSPSLENLNLNYASLYCILDDCFCCMYFFAFTYFVSW